MSPPLVTTGPLKCNDRLINGLLDTKCLKVHENIIIIILKLALCDQVTSLQRQGIFLFKINAFNKDQTQNLLLLVHF